MKYPKCILITGVAGFIGSCLAKKFVKDFPKIKIIGIDNLSNGRLSEVPKEVDFWAIDICNKEQVKQVFKKNKIDIVFHLAAVPRVSYSVKEPLLSSESNINGTSVILEMSRLYKVKRLIFASSSSIYGEKAPMPLKETLQPSPVSPYALHKVVGEQLCKMYSSVYGLDTVCLRYFNVYGPGQYGDSPYSTVISAWLTGLYFPKEKDLFIEGDGKQSKEYTYIDNVLLANILAMYSKKKFRGDCINIAHGQKRNLWVIKKLIEKYSGKKLNLEQRPPRKGDVRKSLANIDLAYKILKYRPLVPFEEGVRITVEWFQKRKQNMV